MNRIEIILEDKDIIVCQKPAGVAVQTKRLGQQDMESMLKNYRVGKGEPPYIGVVHRLDQPVEGVMVFAKTPKAAAALSKQIRERKIGKYYYALCQKGECGLPVSGILTDYMIWNPKENIARIADPKEPQAKKAILEYVIREEYEDSILFDITLHTGRHHQIRLQLSRLGCPILGDSKYGSTQQGTLPRGVIGLCSYRLELNHPVTGKRLDFSIPFQTSRVLTTERD